jgi:hypothetical protein
MLLPLASNLSTIYIVPFGHITHFFALQFDARIFHMSSAASLR